MIDYVFNMLYVMQCEWSIVRPFCLINIIMHQNDDEMTLLP